MRSWMISLLVVSGMIASAEGQIGKIYTPHARHTRLGTIDPLTGEGTDIGSFEQTALKLASGAFDPQGQYYSMAIMLPEDETETLDTQLARVDTVTGAATLVGSPTGEFALPLEIDENGTMYTMRHVVSEEGVGGEPELMNVDPSNGQVSSIGNTGVERAMDLAFDSSGTLWLVGGAEGGNQLYTIDPMTGSSTFQAEITGVAAATEADAEIMGIMFDENDTLYGTAFLRSNPEFVSPLFSIEPTTGAARVIGNTGFVLPHGGDYLVPEPSSWLALIVGAVSLLVIRKN